MMSVVPVNTPNLKLLFSASVVNISFTSVASSSPVNPFVFSTEKYGVAAKL